MINIGLLFSTTTGLTKVQKAKNLKNEPIISAETWSHQEIKSLPLP